MTYPDFCAPLHERLMNELTALEQSTADRLRRSSMSANIARGVIQELENLVKDHLFTDKKEETNFYKEVRPSFYCQLLFHNQVYQIELRRPPGHIDEQIAYISKEMNRLKEFFDDNRFIYKYLRSGDTHLDEMLFFRPTDQSVFAFRMYSNVEEPTVPTNYAPLVAQVKAADLLQLYLEDAMQELAPSTLPKPFRRKLLWTESKAAIVEHAYAFHAAGVFNDGKAELVDIIEAFEWIFQIRLSNYPRTYQEILSRKGSYTKSQDFVKEKYLLRIKTIEDKHIR